MLCEEKRQQALADVDRVHGRYSWAGPGCASNSNTPRRLTLMATRSAGSGALTTASASSRQRGSW
jgi:hypothetical protein